MSRISACGLAPILVLAILAMPARARKDAQSVYEPQSKPGVGQAFLQKFAGTWDVAKTFNPPNGNAPIHLRGTCRQVMINGGRFLRSEFTFGSGEHQTTGMGLIGFEPASGLFTSVWADSRSTRLSLRRSRTPFHGKEIVLYSRSLDTSGKRPTWKSHTVTRLEDRGNKIVHRQYAIGRDGKERLMMELILTRKPAAATRRVTSTS